MEARTVLLTSLVCVLWTSATTGDETFCADKDDGPYCEHCLQPVTCTSGLPTRYQPCGEGMACVVESDITYCLPHTETACACTGVGNQCDAYNPGYMEYCDTSGPFLVNSCPPDAPTCYNDECRAYLDCQQNEWNLTPDCTSLFYCDSEGGIHEGVVCHDGEYVDAEYKCAPAPPPACDGSCQERCPNPVDCTKFFICKGTTAVSSGACEAGSFFDIDVNDCVTSEDHTCTFLDGCKFDVEVKPDSTTTTREITTTSDRTTTATDGTTPTEDVITTTSYGITTTSDVITTTNDGITTTSDVVTTTSDEVTTTSDVVTTTSDVVTTTSDVITTTSDVITTSSDVITTTSDVITTSSNVITTTSDVITTTSDIVTTTSDSTATISDSTATTSDSTTTTSHVITCCSDSRIFSSGITTTKEELVFTVPPDEICDASTEDSKYPFASCSQQYWVCAEMGNGGYDIILTTCLGDWYFNTDSSTPYCNIPPCP